MGSEKVVEKLAKIYENEGGMVGGESKPVDDGTKCPTSNSKSNTNIQWYHKIGQDWS